MAAKKRERPIRHNTALPPVAQAANIALLILGAASQCSWATLVKNPDSYAHIIVSPAQQQLLDDYAYILPYLFKGRKPNGAKDTESGQTRSLYACPVCGRFAFIDKGAPPARCNLTLGCPGRAVKASTMSPRFTAAAASSAPASPRT